MALARIGTPSAVKFVGNLLRDANPDVRLTVVKAVAGSGLGALAMPLATAAEAEEDEALRAELYRALGRVGSNEAVQALILAAQPGGRILGRVSSKKRLHAVEALGLADNPRAKGFLRDLTKDRDKHIREAAEEALNPTKPSEDE